MVSAIVILSTSLWSLYSFILSPSVSFCLCLLNASIRFRCVVASHLIASVRLSIGLSVVPLRLLWYQADDTSSCPPGLVYSTIRLFVNGFNHSLMMQDARGNNVSSLYFIFFYFISIFYFIYFYLLCKGIFTLPWSNFVFILRDFSVCPSIKTKKSSPKNWTLCFSESLIRADLDMWNLTHLYSNANPTPNPTPNPTTNP